MANTKKVTVLGVGQAQKEPPKWVAVLSAVVLFLAGSKGLIVDHFPGTEEQLEGFSKYFDWIMDILQVLSGLLLIFTGTKTVEDES